jgi:transposase
MTHIHGLDRGQLLLLPEAIDDYVATDNPVRFIDAFVEGLDLRVAGFERVEPKATGRPGYAPGDLLKLYSTAISTGCGRAAGLRPNAIVTRVTG